MNFNISGSNEREGRFTKWSFLPRKLNTEYNIVDLMDMLWVDAEIRGFIFGFDDFQLEQVLTDLPDGASYVVDSVYGKPMMIFTKKGQNFVLERIYSLDHAINDRRICSDESSRNESFGRGFMGLGGNSTNVPRF